MACCVTYSTSFESSRRDLHNTPKRPQSLKKIDFVPLADFTPKSVIGVLWEVNATVTERRAHERRRSASRSFPRALQLQTPRQFAEAGGWRQ